MGCRNGMRDILVLAIALVAGVYLINPTLGVLEIIPDNLPIIGNLDEVTATTIVLSALAYFGIDLNNLFGSRDKAKRRDDFYNPDIIEEPRHDEIFQQQERETQRRERR